MDLNLKKFEVWFVTGSQHLYGDDTLRQVEDQAQQIAAAINDHPKIPVTVVHKAVLTRSADIRNLIAQANADNNCIGLIMWMHTFSPARMWISGLNMLAKPYVHLHTQFSQIFRGLTSIWIT